MAARCPNGDLRIIVGFIVVRRRPAGVPAVTAGAPADRRRDIGRKFCHLLSESGGGRTVSQRWPADVRCLTFTTWFKGRENPAMICRCQKGGIGEKSSGHRGIYIPCDVPFRWCHLCDQMSWLRLELLHITLIQIQICPVVYSKLW